MAIHLAFRVLSLFSVLGSLEIFVFGQEGPNPELEIQLLDFPEVQSTGLQSFRRNYCNVSDLVLSERSKPNPQWTLSNALKDFEVSVALYQGEFVNWDVEYDENGNERLILDRDYAGLVPSILDEVCFRAGCNWRNSFAAPSYSDLGNGTFSELLLWSTEMYDITGDWWMRSVERLKAGATFLEPWYDGTIIMIALNTGEEEDEFDAWAFLDPFSRGVWIMVCVTVIASAALYYFFEILNEETDLNEKQLSVIESTWLFATAFAGQFEFNPHTGPALLMSFSTAFWSLLIISAYTANLASFLVIRNQRGVRPETLENAIRLNRKMCVWRSTPTDLSISSSYPAYVEGGHWRRFDDQKDIFRSLRTGDCEIAVTEVSSWDTFQFDEELNFDCALEWVGRPYRTVPASFGVKSDAGELCTSFMRDAMNFHLHNMETDGTIDALWGDHLQRTATINCDEPNLFASTQEEDTEGRRLKRQLKAVVKNGGSEGGTVAAAGSETENEELTLTNMGGVFIVHGLLCSLAFVWALVDWWRIRKRLLKDKEVTPASSSWFFLNRDQTAKEKSSTSSGGNEDDRVVDVDHQELADEPVSTTSSQHYFDAETHASTDALKALRAEMHTKLGSIDEKLAAILAEKKYL